MSWLTLRRQVILATAVFFLGLAAVTGTAYYFEFRIGQMARQTLGVDARRTAAASRAAFAAARLSRLQSALGASANGAAARDALLAAGRTAFLELDQALGQLGELATDAADSARIDQLQTQATSYRRLLEAPSSPSASESELAGQSLAEALESFAARSFVAQEESGQELQRAIDHRTRLVSARAVAAAVGLLLAAIWFSQSVLGRIRVLSAAVGRLACGDLRARIACGGRDELDALATQLNRMASAWQAAHEPSPRRPAETPSDTAPSGSGPALGTVRRDTAASDPDVGGIAPEDPIAADPRPTSDPPPASVPESIPSCRILVTEDGPENRRFMALVLRKAGAEVAMAEDGQKAVEMVSSALGRRQPYDLILMDIELPILDGREATRRIRQEGYAGRIIAVTAHTTAYDQQMCLDAGCDAYLAKPVDREILLTAVASALGRSPDLQPAAV